MGLPARVASFVSNSYNLTVNIKMGATKNGSPLFNPKPLKNAPNVIKTTLAANVC
jgi:hypothetical protein